MISGFSRGFGLWRIVVPLLFVVSSVRSRAQHFVFVLFALLLALCAARLSTVTKACCCLWIAVLLWSKADLAAAQQACLSVLAAMLADLNVPVSVFPLLFFRLFVCVCWGEEEIENVCVCFLFFTSGFEGQLTVTSCSRHIHTTARPFPSPSRSGISVTYRQRALNKHELDLDTHT